MPDSLNDRLRWATAVVSQDAEPDMIGIAAHVLLGEIERLRARVAELEVAVIGERERCAELCEKYADDAYDMDREIAAKELAAAIRSDGHLDNQKTSE